jgi:hypothetical protein
VTARTGSFFPWRANQIIRVVARGVGQQAPDPAIFEFVRPGPLYEAIRRKVGRPLHGLEPQAAGFTSLDLLRNALHHRTMTKGERFEDIDALTLEVARLKSDEDSLIDDILLAWNEQEAYSEAFWSCA